MTFIEQDDKQRIADLFRKAGRDETMPQLTVEDLRRMANPDLTGAYNAADKYLPIEARKELDENLGARSLYS